MANAIQVHNSIDPWTMKQCPACRRAYTDETLNYCLDDGELLIYGPASFDPKTALLSSENMPDEAAAPNLDPASSGARRPHVLSSARTRLQVAVDDTQEPTGHTTALIRPHPTSSAEYIVGQIKLPSSCTDLTCRASSRSSGPRRCKL